MSITSQTKRIQTMGNHVWNENETIVCFYYTKFGFKNLPIKNEEELSHLLNVKVGSFIKQSLNFRMLMGCKTNVLTDYSFLQQQVFELFNNVTMYEFYTIVKDIIHSDDIERINKLKSKGYNINKMVFLNKQ